MFRPIMAIVRFLYRLRGVYIFLSEGVLIYRLPLIGIETVRFLYRLRRVYIYLSEGVLIYRLPLIGIET